MRTKSLGDIIREKREAKGWTQSELAEMLNTYATTIGRYERDQSIPNVWMAYDIAETLGCSLYELLGIEGG